jgi:hypothetical protein
MADLTSFLLLLLAFVAVLITGYLWGRHIKRRARFEDELSAVTRQHIELLQGGQLSETAVESAKARFRELLERGEVAAVEASLRPGMHYVVHVRALTEIGTDEAGRILERQLQRRLTNDQIEQSWYWIDLANGLRNLNREESLPYLLRCAEVAGDVPLLHYFAAETVCFLGFAGYLRQPDSALGRAALRVLHRALEGMRFGVPPQVVTEARLGEAIESLWDHRPARANPLVVRVLYEALRQLRRAPSSRLVLTEEGAEQEGFDWQISRLAALEESLTNYLRDVGRELCDQLVAAPPLLQRDLLLALNDLRAEAAPAVLPLLDQPRFAHPEAAVEVLTWSRDARVSPCLRHWVGRRVALVQRARRRQRAVPPRRPSVPADLPYAAILRALRGHPSPETEAFLLLASRDWDPTYRAAAVSSLGWWEPIHRREALVCLQMSRRDPNPEVRQAARAALARLGERQALQGFRQALQSDDLQHVLETIMIAAAEGLTLLWPDLDKLADESDSDLAHHAREAVERLCEDMDRRRE